MGREDQDKSEGEHDNGMTSLRCTVSSAVSQTYTQGSRAEPCPWKVEIQLDKDQGEGGQSLCHVSTVGLSAASEEARKRERGEGV